jgi:hydrogenase maturation protease
MKTIVLGIGNPILRDDGVGVHVVHQVKQWVTDPTVTVDEAFTGGMNLVDLLVGYDKAILIDTVNLAKAKNGEVKRFRLKDSQGSGHSCNPHDVSLQEALALTERLGETRIPRDIIIIGIVVKKLPVHFGEQLSKTITAAVPKAVDMTLHELMKTNQWRKKQVT